MVFEIAFLVTEDGAKELETKPMMERINYLLGLKGNDFVQYLLDAVDFYHANDIILYEEITSRGYRPIFQDSLHEVFLLNNENILNILANILESIGCYQKLLRLVYEALIINETIILVFKNDKQSKYRNA